MPHRNARRSVMRSARCWGDIPPALDRSRNTTLPPIATSDGGSVCDARDGWAAALVRLCAGITGERNAAIALNVVINFIRVYTRPLGFPINKGFLPDTWGNIVFG